MENEIDRFTQKLETLEKDMDTINYMGATLDKCIAFLKEKSLLEEFYIHALKNGNEEYILMAVDHLNKQVAHHS